MGAFTLHDLQCFDAVARTGGFQAAAALLHRSHPAVFAAVSKLERQLDLVLLDRGGYRVRLTDAGQSFHRHAQEVLRASQDLALHAAQLAAGEESELRIVIGDLCPRPPMLALLAGFFAEVPRTRLHLHFEAVQGPLERLLDGDADLILHGIDKSDPRLEWIDLCKVRLLPVAAPGFLSFRPSRAVRPEQMRPYTQCVIRDTARHSPARDYYLVEGAHQCTVPDHAMKKEVILQGMAWGHLPRFMIEDKLRDGSLVPIAGRYLPGSTEDVAAARRLDKRPGPVAARLWDILQKQAVQIRRSYR